jgi:hypothetical protein
MTDSIDYLDMTIKITKIEIKMARRSMWICRMVSVLLLSLASVEILSYYHHPDYWWAILNAGFQLGMAWSVWGNNRFDNISDLRNGKRLLRRLEGLKTEKIARSNPFSLVTPESKKPK